CARGRLLRPYFDYW
nr:immunoglobulin heavy chain junction region [Mus musculus]NSM07768.1 immunoglobulin heavy chain junction region [Mus musculus]